ncbi:MAG: AsmA family protein [Acidobacteria bacterium]|nr:AsmA family protein [Acidobacteriota bacterium]
MKKALIATVLILIVIAVAGAILLPRLANVEQYRGRIESSLRDRTGWKVTLGNIDLSLLHGPAVRISPVRAADPASHATLEVAELAARAELLPLLRGHLVVHRIDVIGPRITLTRTGDRLALPPWRTPQKTGGATTATASSSRLDVQVQQVRIRQGAVTVSEVGSQVPAWTLSDISTDLDPVTGGLHGSATLPDDGGRVAWKGAVQGPFTLELDAIRSAALPPWLTAGLIRPGTSVSGTVQVTGGDRFEGKLSAHNAAFLAGDAPLDKLGASFKVMRSGERWTLERLDVNAAGVSVTGAGRLLPTPVLSFKIPEAPIGDALRLARATFPLPLDIEGPGNLTADISLRSATGGGLLTTASGRLTAARIRLAPDLPPLENVSTVFRLRSNAVLEADPIAATLAGGALHLQAKVAPAAPPGALSLQGTLKGARLAALLAGFGKTHDKLSGDIDATAELEVDLSRTTLDATTLGGRVEVTANQLELPGWDLVQALDKQLASSSSLLKGLAQIALERAAGAPKPAGEQVAGAGAFERAAATIDLEHIPWRLTRLSLISPELSAAGAGTYDPVSGAVNVDLSAKLGPGVSKRLLAKVPPLRDLRDADGRVVLPLRISGAAASPSITFDLEQALAGKLQPAKGDSDRTKLLKGLMDSLLKKKKD